MECEKENMIKICFVFSANVTNLKWCPGRLLPVRQKFKVFLIVPPARNQMSSKAVAMKVVVALGPDELIPFSEAK